jgi:hypothetical protein
LSRSPFEKYGHAWVEIDGWCIDLTTKVVIPKPIYYHAGKIDARECYKYTPESALRNLLHFHYYGAWEGPFFGGPPIPYSQLLQEALEEEEEEG